MPSPALFVRLCAVAVVLALTGCDVPRFEGPQVQSPPPGFILNARTSQEHRLFPDRPVIHHDAWVRAQWGDFSGIYINGHPGATSVEEMDAARQAALARPPSRPDEVRDLGPVESLIIDGRNALGWSEVVRSDARGIEFVAYRAVVSYDTVSYAVEFISGDPTFKIRTDSLRTVVASFGVGRIRYDVPLILIVAGVLVFLFSRVRARSRNRQLRAASVTLPTIRREDEDEKEKADRVGPPPDPS